MKGDGLRGTGNGADAATYALLRVDAGFGVFSFHVDGIEKAAVEAGPAAHAVLGIDRSPEAARSYEFVGIGQSPVHAAIPATIADDMVYTLTVVRDVDQTFFLCQMQNP